MRNMLGAIATLLLLFTATPVLTQRVTGEDLFQQGLDQERGKRDVQAAIRIYEDILKRFPSNRALMARTLAQLGECYERLGQSSKAQEYYQQVVARYSGQADMAAKARARLASLTGPPASDRVMVPIELWLPQGSSLAHGFRTGVDITLDGKRIAFVASSTPNTLAADPRRMIYVKPMEDLGQTTAVPGTESGYNPFFSPDGTWLGFFAGTTRSSGVGQTTIQIKKVALSEGASPIVLASLRADPNETPDNLGATWGANGTIVFGSARNGLQWIPDGGGDPQPLTHLNAASGEIGHLFPHFLPDASGVLFTVFRGSSDPQIWVQPKAGNPKRVLENGTDARFGGGRLFFAREGKLFAVAFDARTLSPSGAPVPAVEDGVVHAMNSGLAGARTGAAQYSVSQSGALLYAPGSIEPDEIYTVVWVDPQGGVTPLAIKPRHYVSARVSPDGRYVLLTSGFRREAWVHDTVAELEESQSGVSGWPAEWSPDGARIAFWSSDATHVKDLASSKVSRVVSGYRFAAWTPDGRELAMLRTTAGKMGIHVLALERPDQVRPLLQDSTYNYAYPTFSPDGRWLAYCSDESGRYEVYVQPYPGPGPRVRVSNANSGAATEPAWSRDGQHVFYASRGRILSVRFEVSNGQFVPEPPTVLLSPQFVGTTPLRSWDVAPDGRFVMIQPESQEDRVQRERKIFPSTLVLLAPPSTRRITIGPGPAVARAAGTAAPAGRTALGWRGPGSQRVLATAAQDEYLGPELSRDGKWVAFARGNPRNLWRMELGTDRLERVTTNNANWANPRWSPDGTMIAADRTQDGVIFVIRMGAPGLRNEVIFTTTGTPKILSDWSADGRYLAYISNGDVFALPLSADLTPGEPLQITTTPSAEGDARISPDGRWIAYVSNEQGRRDVYIQSFPSGTVKQLVSRDGAQPRWADGGRTLVYFGPTTTSGRFVAVSITATTAGQLDIGEPQEPWGTDFGAFASAWMEHTYSPSPDGRLLIQLQLSAGPPPDPLWTALLAGDVPGAFQAIKGGADVNGRNQSSAPNPGRPLHYAAENDLTAIITALLDAGADINMPNVLGHTPVHRAAEFGRREAAALLIARGASLTVSSNDGETPLDVAVRRGHADVANLIRDALASRRR